MSDTLFRSEPVTVTLRTHEDYRDACERIGQLEGIRPSAARDRQLAALRAAIHAYEPRQTPLRTSR
ncbi:hypothetical protein AB4099_09695 [Bosea sp. 2KB_26]|uniref:hypothetical protein n=1 Tax=Bosea sp. 2KB_26 TaxID=3237475 RepID=UPI003F922A63